MTLAVIGFGSNLGDGPHLVQSAWARLSLEPKIVPLQLSALYVTEAVGMVSSSLFTNAVGLVETALGPTELLHLLLQVEMEYGRVRNTDAAGYQDRLLDLDLLYFGELVCQLPDLILPHPHLASRLFVLAPLAQLIPNFTDPVSGKTAEQMYQQLLASIEKGDLPAQHISRLA